MNKIKIYCCAMILYAGDLFSSGNEALTNAMIDESTTIQSSALEQMTFSELNLRRTALQQFNDLVKEFNAEKDFDLLIKGAKGIVKNLMDGLLKVWNPNDEVSISSQEIVTTLSTSAEDVLTNYPTLYTKEGNVNWIFYVHGGPGARVWNPKNSDEYIQSYIENYYAINAGRNDLERLEDNHPKSINSLISTVIKGLRHDRGSVNIAMATQLAKRGINVVLLEYPIPELSQELCFNGKNFDSSYRIKEYNSFVRNVPFCQAPVDTLLQQMDSLKKSFEIPEQNIRLFGHSMGAEVVSFMQQKIQENLLVTEDVFPCVLLSTGIRRQEPRACEEGEPVRILNSVINVNVHLEGWRNLKPIVIGSLYNDYCHESFVLKEMGFRFLEHTSGHGVNHPSGDLLPFAVQNPEKTNEELCALLRSEHKLSLIFYTPPKEVNVRKVLPSLVKSIRGSYDEKSAEAILEEAIDYYRISIYSYMAQYPDLDEAKCLNGFCQLIGYMTRDIWES